MGRPDLRSQLKQVPRLWCRDPGILSPEQTHYLKKVLRLRLGDPILVLNGHGLIWRGQWQGERVEDLVAIDHPSTENPYPVWLGVGVLKGEAMDWLIQKATELGVTTVQPLLTQYTQLTPSPQKQARWQQIAQEACEQSERLYLPEIAPVLPLDKVRCPCPLGLIAMERGLAPGLAARLQGQPPQAVGVWIGPEGGWSPAEQEYLLAQAQAVDLGPRILRAETAVCAALSVVNSWQWSP